MDFLTADELDITQSNYEALIKTLEWIESDACIYIDREAVLNNEIKMPDTPDIHYFNMNLWNGNLGYGDFQHKCGTVGCIGGTAEKFFGAKFNGGHDNMPSAELNELFYPNDGTVSNLDYNDITKEQAAQGLRNYLTTGSARWDTILE